MKYAQLVVGPAGSGKSTYCSTVQDHCKTVGRTVFVVNLDPAAEVFNYESAVDIRELISVDDVLEDDEMALGPNGALIYCMEYLAENLDWLHEQLNEAEDDYFLFDCPGQVELYSHLPVMRQIVDALHQWDFNVCSTFILDTGFCLDPNKFMSAALTTLSTLVSLQTPAVNVLSKMDLLSHEDQKTIGELIDGDLYQMLDQQQKDGKEWGEKYRKLSEAIASVLDSYSLVKFLPLNIEDEETIEGILLAIDTSIQYGENAEIRDRYPIEADPEE